MLDPADLNLLGLNTMRSGAITRFGSIEVGFAIADAQVRSQMNQLATASVKLRLALTAGRPVDYLSPLVIGTHRGSSEKIHFTGAVVSAEPIAGIAHIEALTAAEMTETQVDALELRDVSPPEALHMMARSGGFSNENINIEGVAGLAGLEAHLPTEAIEALAPLYGVTVVEPVRIHDVLIIPRATGAAAVSEFTHQDAVAEFQEADSYALFMDVAKRLLDIEERALQSIDVALAWLTVRSRYGLARMPNGTAQRFDRRATRARPRRGRLVFVRAVATNRRWLRTPIGANVPQTVVLDPVSDPTWRPPLGTIPTLQDRQSLLACSRAAVGGDELERIQALWEAIEFYVSGVAPSRLFDNAEVKRLRKSIPKDIAPELRQRAIDLLAKIDDPPLLAKLHETLRRDGVPIAESEFTLLKELRVARNDAVHGRSPQIPSREAVDHAVSVVARMILHRLDRD